MSLPLCSRSKDIIEPMLKPQWWVNCQDMAAEACAAARDGRLQILPQEFEAVWFRYFSFSSSSPVNDTDFSCIHPV
jgi:valyl-tRNA synthetase